MIVVVVAVVDVGVDLIVVVDVVVVVDDDVVVGLGDNLPGGKWDQWQNVRIHQGPAAGGGCGNR